MTRLPLARISVVAIAALVAGACGSAASNGHPAARTAPPKLSLTKAGGSGGSADAARKPGALALRPVTYVLDGKLADLGSSGQVYRWTAHDVNIAEVDQIARALGINAAATATADGFQASDSDATLTVTVGDGTTQVSYYPGSADAGGGSSGSSTGSVGSGIAPDGSTTDGSTTDVPPAPPTAKTEPVTTEPVTTEPPPRVAPVDVPSAHDAEATARQLLDNAGVLAGQQWVSEVTDSGGIAISCTVGSVCSGVPEQVSARDVTFHLVIGDVRVTGADWTVTVGEHSKIQSVYGEWASAVPLGTYGLRSTADAFTALKNGDSGSGGVEPLTGEVPVNAQDTPTGDKPVRPLPPGTGTLAEPPVDPVVVHVTGVSLGISRWDAVDGTHNVVDLVPVYVFHTSTADPAGGDPSTSDVEQLALDPGAIQFAEPIPVPVPEPGTVPAPGANSTQPGSPPEAKPAPAP